MIRRRNSEGIKARQFGEWEVVGWLGGGGAGDVYEVRNAADRRAALKVFRQDRRAKVVHKHDLELDFMDTHREYPGILPFIDSQLEEDEERAFWYVMPFADPLDKSQEVLVNPYELLKAIASVAATLADLSLQGVHHRDLKPSNIFIQDGRALVGDFAFIPLAEIIDLTAERPMGPSEFTAPEVVTNGALIDAEKADVYSLGRVLSLTLGQQMHDIRGLEKAVSAALNEDPKLRPNMARFGGELFEIYDGAELTVFPEPTPQLDVAVGRLNRLLEGEMNDESRRPELIRQARATYAALKASTLGTSLNSLSRVRSLQIQEVELTEEDIHIPVRKASLLHKGADAVIASVPGAVLTVSVHAGFWEGIQSDLLKVSVQREWGEAAISMRIYWIEADRETDVWAFAWQETLRAARSARSFNDLGRQTTQHLSVAYDMLSNWVDRREMPEG